VLFSRITPKHKRTGSYYESDRVRLIEPPLPVCHVTLDTLTCLYMGRQPPHCLWTFIFAFFQHIFQSSLANGQPAAGIMRFPSLDAMLLGCIKACRLSLMLGMMLVSCALLMAPDAICWPVVVGLLMAAIALVSSFWIDVNLVSQ